MERYMDDDMLVEHGKDTTQMWVKYEDCAQEIALTKADAQATIAALQARVRELEQAAGAMSCKDIADKVAGYDDLQAQLTQRTAELEAANKKAAEQGRYAVEMFDELKRVQAELERVRGELVEATHNANVYQSLYSTGCMDRALLGNELRDLRALIMAYAEAKTDFDDKRLQEDHYARKERYNKLVEAENALLQHRQRMEGQHESR